MADVISLPKRQGGNLLDQYRHLLADPIDEFSELAPLDDLVKLRREIEASLTAAPASRKDVAKAVAVLMASCNIGNGIEDRAAFSLGMIEELAAYPANVLEHAVRRARQTMEWVPSIAKMIAICNELILAQKLQLGKLDQMEREHHRRRQDAEREAKRAAEREAYRQAEFERLRDLEVRVRERFGDDGPLPGDIELADSLSPALMRRAGKRMSWQAALAVGEHWAAQYCRQMALAERVRRAHTRGHVSWHDAVAVVKLIVVCEESARHQIEDMEGRSAGYQDGKLTEGFWRAVWKIAGACGLDTPVFPEDRVAVALNNLKHLAGLAELEDTRAILDQQVRDKWEQRPSARSER